MAITLSGDGISSDAIASLAASKLTGQVPDANAPSGSVIQVVTAQINSDRVNVSSGSFTTVGNGVTITPSSASNKILLLASVNINIAHELSFGRSGNNNLCGVTHGLLTYSGAVWGNEMLYYIDSPASTSALTYYLTCRGYNGSTTTVYFGDFSTGGPFSYITALEIAA